MASGSVVRMETKEAAQHRNDRLVNIYDSAQVSPLGPVIFELEHTADSQSIAPG